MARMQAKAPPIGQTGSMNPGPIGDDESAESAADEAAELTPLGKRTLAGFIKQWGPDQGLKKFEAAMDNGTIDRTKMEKQPDVPDGTSMPMMPMKLGMK